ncbi:unnamed protein product [Brassica rapa]|uniref:Uncharacterized protein n=2 Tax=Brassica TaxID=3705 RepID=A0A8D9I2Q3_BRACM|nr:unnamed protein product [Brassica napus]CAG7909609.1 unnamed protein product [Brassica rapa]
MDMEEFIPYDIQVRGRGQDLLRASRLPWMTTTIMLSMGCQSGGRAVPFQGCATGLVLVFGRDYSRHTDLSIKVNNDRSRDYTMPDVAVAMAPQPSHNPYPGIVSPNVSLF